MDIGDVALAKKRRLSADRRAQINRFQNRKYGLDKKPGPRMQNLLFEKVLMQELSYPASAPGSPRKIITEADKELMQDHLGSLHSQIKIVDLPKLPFGQHQTYNDENSITEHFIKDQPSSNSPYKKGYDRMVKALNVVRMKRSADQNVKAKVRRVKPNYKKEQMIEVEIDSGYMIYSPRNSIFSNQKNPYTKMKFQGQIKQTHRSVEEERARAKQLKFKLKALKKKPGDPARLTATGGLRHFSPGNDSKFDDKYPSLFDSNSPNTSTVNSKTDLPFQPAPKRNKKMEKKPTIKWSTYS